MPPSPLDALIAELRQYQLLTPAQLEELTLLRARFPDPRALVRELLQRDWLTAFQANRLLQGQAKELVLGSYLLLERLGEGGMGQVFKARHRHMDRLVALKVIHKERLADPSSLERFRREVRAAAQLSHPNIAAAHDADAVGGVHFLAMEYVDGPDLARLVQQSGPLPVARACEYVRQAALGLQHAHEKGLVHRDIKPGNLLVANPGGNGAAVVKVLDFGLARFESENGQQGRLTQVGKVVGTVDYISPEQAESPRLADIRADIYSLGCSLFYLLTGRPPFLGADTVERLSARLLGEAPPVRSLRPEVPVLLERVLAKMLARDPRQRYPAPAQVAAALEPFAREAGPAAETAVTPAAPPPRRTAIPKQTKVEEAPAPEPEESGEDFAVIGPASRPTTPRRRHAARKSSAWPVVAGILFGMAVGIGFLVWLINNSDPGKKPDLVKVAPDGTPAPGNRLPNPGAGGPTDGGTPVTPRKSGDTKPPKDAGSQGGFTDTGPGAGADSAKPSTGSEKGKEPRGEPNPKGTGEDLGGQGTGRQGHSGEERKSKGTGGDAGEQRTGRRGHGDPKRDEEPKPAPKGEVRRLQGGPALAFAPDGSHFIYAAPDHSLRLCAVATGKKERRFPGHTGKVLDICFARDGRCFVSSGEDGTLFLWDPEKDKFRAHFTATLDKRYPALAVSENGSRVCWSASDQTLLTQDLKDKSTSRAQFPEGSGCYVLAIAPDLRHALAGAPDKSWRLWDWDQQASVDRPHAAEARFYSGAFSPGGRYALLGGADNDLRLWDLRGGKEKEIGLLKGHHGPVRSAAFSPSLRYAVSGATDGEVILWDLEARRPAHRFRALRGAVDRVAVSRDDRRVLSGSPQGYVSLWKVPRPDRPPAPLPEDSQAGTAVVRKSSETGATKSGRDKRKASEGEDHTNRRESKSRKLAVPARPAQDEARGLVHKLFKVELGKRKRTERQELADQLLQQGAKSKGEKAAVRYVLLLEARDAARRAADPVRAWKAVREMARQFDVDPAGLMADALEKAEPAARTKRDRSALLGVALFAANEAGTADNYAAADRLVNVAQRAAGKVGVKALVKVVQAEKKAVEQRRQGYELVKPLLARLLANPKDPEANLAAGKYRCFAKGDWAGGLPLLARGADPGLKELAEAELAEPAKAGEQEKLGDRWRARAEGLPEWGRIEVLLHARSWYDRAAADAEGFARTRVEKKRDDVDKDKTIRDRAAPRSYAGVWEVKFELKGQEQKRTGTGTISAPKTVKVVRRYAVAPNGAVLFLDSQATETGGLGQADAAKAAGKDKPPDDGAGTLLPVKFPLLDKANPNFLLLDLGLYGLDYVRLEEGGLKVWHFLPGRVGGATPGKGEKVQELEDFLKDAGPAE